MHIVNTHVHADHITGSGLLKKIISEQTDRMIPQSVIAEVNICQILNYIYILNIN